MKAEETVVLTSYCNSDSDSTKSEPRIMLPKVNTTFSDDKIVSEIGENNDRSKELLDKGLSSQR